MNDKIKEAFKWWERTCFARPEYQDFEAGYLAAQKEATGSKPVAYISEKGALLYVGVDYIDPSDRPLYALPPDQSARIAELHQQLAAAQAENKKLRELIPKLVDATPGHAGQCSGLKCREQYCYSCNGEEDADKYLQSVWDLCAEANKTLATPSDNSALESLLEAERQKVAEACAKVVDYHYDECEPWLDREMLLREWKGFVK